jgi:predicted ferric reductase
MSTFIPGQFVFLHILDKEGKSMVKKPYSIASSPGSSSMEFCIKMIHGALTGPLEDLSAGSIVGIEGPLGHFTFSGRNRAGFIAGGTGIAPIMSMLRHITNNRIDGEFFFFYSAKNEDKIIYREELEQIARNNPNIKIVVTLTNGAANGWSGERGRINSSMISRHMPAPSQFDWWICGPMEMIKAMRGCLEELGADPKRMKMEGWG